YFLIFFFQAEDGIRDDLVTGVQTCALPICRGRTLTPPPPASKAAESRSRPMSPRNLCLASSDDPHPRTRFLRVCIGPRIPSASRSEERRVGKECRSRRSWEQETEQVNESES